MSAISSASKAPGYVLIYDRAGVSEFSSQGAYNQIKELADDRLYRVELFSQSSHALNDLDQVCLIVIPGGSYLEMEPELKQVAKQIRQLVIEKGTSYLGICAGAIAACSSSILTPMDGNFEDVRYIQKVNFKPSDLFVGKMHLKLYEQECASLAVPAASLPSTQVVELGSREMSSFDKYDSSQKKLSFPLFFKSGVFFPNIWRDESIVNLLDYRHYAIRGCYHYPDSPTFTSDLAHTVAAVKCKAGLGKMVLSGVHPEIDSAAVLKFSSYSDKWRNEVLIPTSDNLKSNEGHIVMHDYLENLSIATK